MSSLNNLNFQQHQYQDPTAALQQSLGAGGIFSKTLSQWAEDDAMAQKMELARKEQARQDYEFEMRKKDREKAEQQERTSADFMTKMMNPDMQQSAAEGLESAAKETGMIGKMTDTGDKSITGYDASRTTDIADLRSKLAADQNLMKGNAVRDTLLNADFDKSFSGDYTFGSKARALIEGYRATGMGADEASSAAAKALGVNGDLVKSAVGVESTGNEYNRLLDDMASKPNFQKSGMETANDFLAEEARLHPERFNVEADGSIGSYKNLNILSSVANQRDAYSKAIQENKAKIDAMREKLATGVTDAERNALEMQLKMLELKTRADESYLKAAGRGGSGIELSDGTYLGGSKGGATKYQKEVAGVLKDVMSAIGSEAWANSANSAERSKILSAYNNAVAAGVRPEVLSTALLGSFTVDKGEDGEPPRLVYKDNDAKLTFKDKRNIMSNEEILAYNGIGYDSGASQADIKALADKNRLDTQKQISMLADYASKADANKLATLRANIANLEAPAGERTFADAKSYALDILRQKGLAGGSTQPTVETPKTKVEFGGTGGTGSGSGSGTGLTPVAPAANKSQKINPIDAEVMKKYSGSRKNDTYSDGSFLDIREYEKMDNTQRNASTMNETKALLLKREGPPPAKYTNSKNGTYTTYLVDGVPHVGMGVKLETYNSATGNKYKLGDTIPIREVEAFTQKTIQSAHSQAIQQAKDLGLDYRAVPVLASTIYNLGPAWAKHNGGFGVTYDAIKNGDYARAAKNFASSKWWKQTGGARPTDMINMLNLYGKTRVNGYQEIEAKQKFDKEYADIYNGNKKQDNGREAIINAIVKGTKNVSPDTFISNSDRESMNSFLFDKAKSDAIKDKANDMFDEYQMYQNQHDIKSSLRLKQLTADGKAPDQIELIKKAGLEASYAAAKSPQARLKEIEKAQMLEAQKLTEESKKALNDTQRANILNEARRRGLDEASSQFGF